MPGEMWEGGWRSAPDVADFRFRPPARVVLIVPVVVSVLVQVPATTAIAVWTRPPVWAAVLAVAVALAGALALLAARRFPGPTVAAVSALAVAAVFVPPHIGPPFVAIVFAIIGAVARGARLWALVSVGAGWLFAVVAGGFAGLDWHPLRLAGVTAVVVACFAVGEGLRTRLERARARREQLAARRESAEQSERTRIARELHDVLAHSLSQISVQSGVALHLFDREPERAREALASIRALSGTGLDEVRGVLAFLRGDEAAPLTPQPQLAELPALVAARSGLGLDVALRELDEGAPSSAVQTTAYRIVQEALTNVVRHSGATRAAVALDREGGTLVVTVDDDGLGLPDAATTAGAGIRGMRERAELLGGSLSVEPRPEVGTRVVARLPWAEER